MNASLSNPTTEQTEQDRDLIYTEGQPPIVSLISVLTDAHYYQSRGLRSDDTWEPYSLQKLISDAMGELAGQAANPALVLDHMRMLLHTTLVALDEAEHA